MSGLVVATAFPPLAWVAAAGDAVYVITVRAVGRGVAAAPVATVAVATAGATGTAVAGAGSAVAVAGTGTAVASAVGNCSNTWVVAVASVASTAALSPGFWVNMVPAYQ